MRRDFVLIYGRLKEFSSSSERTVT